MDKLPEWAQRLVKELRQENAGHRKKAKDAEELGAKAEEQRLADEKKFQELAEKRAKELDTIKAELAAERLTRLRGEVAAAAGLPATLAERLRGTSKEELEADAKELKKLIPATATATAPGAPSGPNRDGKSKTPDDAKKEAVRRRFGISS